MDLSLLWKECSFYLGHYVNLVLKKQNALKATTKKNEDELAQTQHNLLSLFKNEGTLARMLLKAELELVGKGCLGASVKVLSLDLEVTGLGSWKHPLTKCSLRFTYNSLLWWDPSPYPHSQRSSHFRLIEYTSGVGGAELIA